jgi:hypothetical protein
MLRPLMAGTFLLYAQTAVVSVPIRITVVGPSVPERLEIRLSVRQLSNDVAPSARNLVVINGEAQSELSILPGDYAIEAEAAGFWAPPYSLKVTPGQAATADLKMWVTNDLIFDVSTPRKLAAHELVIQFRAAPPATENVSVPVGIVSCPILERRATCSLPAARLDLRVLAAGRSASSAFTPEYLWDVDNRSRQKASVSLSLVTGSSLIGYVRNEKGDPAIGARVQLRTPGGGQIVPAASTLAGRPPSSDAHERGIGATTNHRGFFQMKFVTPGDYRLVASNEEGGASGQMTVAVDPDRETVLGDFLPLERPYQVPLTIDPPVHGDAEHWSISLLRLTPVTNELRYTTGDDGFALLDLGRGAYTITVLASGQKFFLQSFEVDEQPGPLSIKIPMVQVVGKVSLGGKPIQARLIFGGERGPRSVTMESNEVGGFSGVLPQEGDWQVQVEALSPPVHRRLRRVNVARGSSGKAEVEIQLKNSRLNGRVVGDDGKLVGNALVKMIPFNSPEDSAMQFAADDTGTFELAGLSPGVLTLEAQTPDLRSSDPVVVTLGDDAAEVTLVVGDRSRLAGRVLSAVSSQPLAGASIIALRFVNKPMTATGPVRTDAEGRFELLLPPKTVSVSIAYWADGHSLNMMEVGIAPTTETVLLSSPVGGTLTVTLPKTQSGDSSLPVVVHKGAVLPPRALATIRPGPRPSPDGAPVTIADLAPGSYSVCTMDIRAFQLGYLPTVAPDRCSSGVLTPGGTLNLSMPDKAEQASR